MDMPILLLMLAGLINSLILPIVLAFMLTATRRKDIVGDYKHPLYLSIMGVLIVIGMGIASFGNVGNFIAKFIAS